MRQRLQRVAQPLDPLHGLPLVCWIDPAPHDVQLVTERPQSKSRIAQPHARNGTMAPKNGTIKTLVFGGASLVAVTIVAIAAALNSGRNRFVWKCATGAAGLMVALVSRYDATRTLSCDGLSDRNGPSRSFPRRERCPVTD
jgi:hypothetical protein